MMGRALDSARPIVYDVNMDIILVLAIVGSILVVACIGFMLGWVRGYKDGRADQFERQMEQFGPVL